MAFENPRFIDRTLNKIRSVQKQLSRKQKGSRRRERVRLKQNSKTQQSARRLHKLSRYVNNYEFEDLDVKDLAGNGNRTLNRHIHFHLV